MLRGRASARKRRQAERESLRRELANSFLEKLGGASDATRKALDAQTSVLAPEAAKERLERAEWLLGEVAARLASVRVRLPADAGSAARAAVEELQRTAEHLDLPPASKEALKEAHEAFEWARQARRSPGCVALGLVAPAAGSAARRGDARGADWSKPAGD